MVYSDLLGCHKVKRQELGESTRKVGRNEMREPTMIIGNPYLAYRVGERTSSPCFWSSPALWPCGGNCLPCLLESPEEYLPGL